MNSNESFPATMLYPLGFVSSGTLRPFSFFRGCSKVKYPISTSSVRKSCKSSLGKNVEICASVRGIPSIQSIPISAAHLRLRLSNNNWFKNSHLLKQLKMLGLFQGKITGERLLNLLNYLMCRSSQSALDLKNVAYYNTCC